ncbi:hypothetical protein [Sphingomonas abaci]|uniref:Cellulose-binding protein n=1 Tax=Sphingomonas abaci TaxID=237611 RepID=A0A7W7AIC2_9SPHN|nr:hypothetical protein [Sphingomonas abaci]MBB4617575.1 hypothetical protein [Sphingomonas abaci]
MTKSYRYAWLGLALFAGGPTACQAQPQAAATAGPVKGARFEMGINLSSIDYYSGEYAFMNLLTGSHWVDTKDKWQDLPDSQIDSLGMVRQMPAGASYARILTPPSAVFTGRTVSIRCTWTGSGDVSIGGSRKNLFRSDHSLTFDWPAAPPPEGNSRNWLELSNMSAADPVRDVDCREKGAPRDQVFATQFVDSLKPFSVIRFLDWSSANPNPDTFTWANRSLPNGINQVDRARGVALEQMLALAKAADADPWFTIPWNADADYVTRMAKLVHDRLPPGHRAYVELANEPWNYAFPLAHQIQKEGLAAGLDTNGFQANLKRYSQKTIATMRIWSAAFADRPASLVRVAGSQAVNPWATEQILAYPGLPDAIDAVAIAPYFQYDASAALTAPLPERLASLRRGQANVLAQAWKTLDLVRGKGKRLITYEGGQHVTDFTPGGGERVQQVNRSPEMERLYRDYIAAWKARVGDLMVLYNATGPAGGGGAWGIREYAGQPLDQTPKRRAALAFARQTATP